MDRKLISQRQIDALKSETLVRTVRRNRVPGLRASLHSRCLNMIYVMSWMGLVW